MKMKTFLLCAVAGVLLLLGLGALQVHQRAASDRNSTAAPAAAAEPDCATPPPPEAKPPAPAGFVMTEACADAEARTKDEGRRMNGEGRRAKGKR